jgi:hypothetical protein
LSLYVSVTILEKAMAIKEQHDLGPEILLCTEDSGMIINVAVRVRSPGIKTVGKRCWPWNAPSDRRFKPVMCSPQTMS